MTSIRGDIDQGDIDQGDIDQGDIERVIGAVPATHPG